jgi:hypothetical protein
VHACHLNLTGTAKSAAEPWRGGCGGGDDEAHRDGTWGGATDGIRVGFLYIYF